MKLTIEVLEQTEDGLFSRVIDEEGKQICIADGNNPFDSIKNVSLVLADIMDFISQEETKEIYSIIKKG